MVLIRFGRDGVTRGNDKSKQQYLEDSIWSTEREATLRENQLTGAGYFVIVDTKRYTNAPTEYVVWRSESKRRGTRHGKKTERRRASKKP